MQPRHENVRTELLHESVTNPRRAWDPEAQKQLTESVREHGLINPLTVREYPTVKGDYEIVAGARRFRACRDAGMAEIPCLVHELSDRAALEVQLFENLQRADVHFLDEAISYKRLKDDHGYSAESLAARVHKSPSYIYGRIQLAELPLTVQEALFTGELDLSTGLLLVRVTSPKLCQEAATQILAGNAYGKPMPYKHAVEFVRRNYQLELANAPFDTSDKDLLKSAGSCDTCPKRTGNQQTLFGAVAGEKAEGGEPDLCTDPKCFEAKTVALFDRRAVEVEAKGGTVFRGKSAADKLHSDDYAQKSGKVMVDGKPATWAQLTKGQDVPPVLFRGRDGEPVTRYLRKALEKAAKANGHKISKDQVPSSPARHANTPPPQTEEQKQVVEQRALRDRVTARVRELIVDLLTKEHDEAVAARVWRVVVADMVEQAWPSEPFLKEWKVKRGVEGSGLRRTCDISSVRNDELAAFALDMLLRSLDAYEDYDELLVAAAKAVGVDIESIEREFGGSSSPPPAAPPPAKKPNNIRTLIATAIKGKKAKAKKAKKGARAKGKKS